MSENSNLVTVETLSDLYEWALYYHIDFVIEGFETYLQLSQHLINSQSRCGERKTICSFYKALSKPIDAITLEMFDKIVCNILSIVII